MSPKYSLNKEDLFKIASALLFSVLSAMAVTAIALIQEIDFGAYAFLVPLINVILYSAKKYLEGR